MLSTYTSYRLATRDLDTTLSRKAQEKPVALETKYYLENIAKVNSVDDFLKDTRLFKFAMKAFGLDDLSHAKGLMRKVLSESPYDDKSYVNRVADDRFIDFATTFNFADTGPLATATQDAGQGVVDRYIRQTLEVDLGEENQAVRLALYFERSVDKIKTGYSILADSALQEVVYTALGFPDEMKAADIDRQAATIEKRLDLESLKDPETLAKFLMRFAAVWDAKNGIQTSPILSLFSGGSTTSVGLDLVMTLQNLKRGG